MRVPSIAFLIFSSALLAAAQASTPESIRDPRALLAAAAPLYDFANPALKPWHLKAAYQIYDQDGNPGEEGTWEYWWASPDLYRNTWTRGALVESQWHMPVGNRAEVSSGTLHLFETSFPAELFTPLPDLAKIAAPPAWLERFDLPSGKAKVPCVRALTRQILPQPGGIPRDEVLNTWCFDPKVPIVLFKSEASNGRSETYGNFARFQDRTLPRTFLESVNGRKLLSASIDMLGSLDPADPALTPPTDARTQSILQMQVPSGIMLGNRIKAPNPEYPLKAKLAHLAGTVIIEAQIGKDGKIKDIEVVSTPGPLLTDSAVKAVSQWEYRPYQLNGQPIDVRTTINVTYALGS
jgi:TonB family protein